ncbi:MAG: hypothetical protein U0694_08910 [Anaerolineae bacterium]
MAATTYALEHFYYGKLVRNGKPEGDARALAKSPRVTEDQISECIRTAPLPPLAGVQQGSWALVRGRAVPFIMAQSALNKIGQPMVHYVLIPGEVARSLGGNLKALLTLVDYEIPTFDRLSNLEVINLPPPAPQSSEQQTDDILNLMTFTRNKMATIESLVAAIVEGVPIVVQKAPLDLAQRVGFVEGLLAMLPASARFGVTFTTFVQPNSKLEAQIRFTDGAPDGAMIFDWQSGTLSGKDAEDDYAHFIISQLRLDAGLVIEQTSVLTNIASWRIKRGDRLSDALKYAAYRLKVDDALRNGQPVEAEDVSKILVEDPTLSEDQKRLYSLHLLSFALALGDMSHALPVAISLRQNPELEREVLVQMANALREGKTQLIYETLFDWLEDPAGPQGMKWVELLHRAALIQLDSLVKSGDSAEVNEVLARAVRSDAAVSMNKILPKMIELSLPLTTRDAALALNVMGLAIQYMDNEGLRQLLAARPFRAALPRQVELFAMALEGVRVTQDFMALNLPVQDDSKPGRRGTGMLNPDALQAKRQTGALNPAALEAKKRSQSDEYPAVSSDPKRAGVLYEASRVFGEGRRVALMRFVELALASQRADLIDAYALNGMVKVALSPLRDQYNQTFLWVLRTLQPDSQLATLESPGPRVLLQLMLACGLYRELAQEIPRHSRIFFPGNDRMGDYLMMILRVFSETPLPTEVAEPMLNAIQEAGIKGVPLMMAYIGVLESRDYAPELAKVALTATTTLEANRVALEEVIPINPVLSLLKYHCERKDVTNAVRVAGFVPQVAARHGGLPAITRMFKMMQWDGRTRLAALDELRRFVRYADEADAQKAVSYFGKELGVKIQESLEATYFMRGFMGDTDMHHYSEVIHRVRSLLFTLAQAYDDQKIMPSIGAVQNDLDSLQGGLSNEDRMKIASYAILMGEAVAMLGQYHKDQKGARDPNQVAAVLAGKAEPKSALDVFRVMGGYLTKGRKLPYEFTKSPHQHPLGERSAVLLMEDLQLGNSLLRSAMRAVPLKKNIPVSIGALHTEMESLWSALSTRDQREMAGDLAADLQQIADLVIAISEKGGREALPENSGLGKALDGQRQRPKNALEFLRYMHGYFKSKLR